MRKYFFFWFRAFSNYTIAYECTDFCDENLSSCLKKCYGAEDCVFKCEYQKVSCLSTCPCFENCKAGCENCDGVFCKCYDYESNPEFVTCKQYYESIYNDCLLSCSPGDISCIAVCARELDSNVEFCPCKSQCLNGCPCDNYDCPETTKPVQPTPAPTEKSTVLVLNTWSQTTFPILTDLSGRVDYNFYFLMGVNVTIFKSCSINWRNEFYIYGGDSSNGYQISKLSGTHVERIGDLNVDFQHGACGVAGNKIYLCFSEAKNTTAKECVRASDPLDDFKQGPSTSYDHYFIQLAASTGINIIFSR